MRSVSESSDASLPSTPTGAPSAAAGIDPVQNSKLRKMLEEEGLEESYTPDAGGLRFEAAAVGIMPNTGAEATAPKTMRTGAPPSDNPLFFADLKDFVSRPAPEGVIVQCKIIRDKRGVDKGMFPTYILKLERPEDGGVKQVFLLAGRKRKKSKSSNYIISMDQEDMSRESDNFVAKLRANFLGTNFTVFDDGVSPNKSEQAEAAAASTNTNPRQELAAVLYETNVLGFKGPRKMTIVIPGMDDQQKRIAVSPDTDYDSIVERYKRHDTSNFLVLHNKQPTWNEETQSYVLNFHGRVTQASVKNFQIIHDGDPDYVIMQFGRVNENTFSMDFQYPMSAIQAFGVALSSFDGKLACE